MGLHRVVEHLFNLVHPVVQGLVLFGVKLRQPVTGELHFPVFVEEGVGRGHFVHVFEKGFRAGGVLERKVVFQHGPVQLFLEVGMVQKAFDLRAKHQGVAHLGVVQGLDAEKVPGAKQLPFLFIPNDKGEHPPQFVQELFAVFLVAVEQYLGIGGGFEHMAGCQQVFFDLLEVVDLPVEGEHFRTIFV